MGDPEVDVIVAVHTPSRPVERAVASVLEHTAAPVRVTVVVHNTDPGPIRERLSRFLDDPRLRIETWTDEFRTPAGPKNHGLSLATAPFAAMLDSDDSLEPGALDAWLAAARTRDGLADAVIAPTAGSDGVLHPSPPIRARMARSGRGVPLDPVRDRLAYRASPLGLIGRTRFAHLRFSEGVPTGEDQPLSAALWFTPGNRVVFPVHAPRYREHDDQADRVTGERRAVREDFLQLDLLLDPAAPWNADPRVRLSFAVKLIRVHLFDSVHGRVGRGTWSRENAEELAELASRILAWEPRAPRLLARADAALLRAVRSVGTDEGELVRLLEARSRLRSFAALVPHRAWLLLHAQAPLRYHLAGALLLRESRRG